MIRSSTLKLVNVVPNAKPTESIAFKLPVRKTSSIQFPKNGFVVKLASTSLRGAAVETFDFSSPKGSSYLEKEKQTSLLEIPIQKRLLKRTISSKLNDDAPSVKRVKRQALVTVSTIALMNHAKVFMNEAEDTAEHHNVSNVAASQHLQELLSVTRQANLRNARGWARKEAVKKFPIADWVMTEFKKAWIEGHLNKAYKWSPKQFQDYICAKDDSLIVRSCLDLTRIKQTFSLLTTQFNQKQWIPDMQQIEGTNIQNALLATPLPTLIELDKMKLPALKAFLKSRGLNDKLSKPACLATAKDYIKLKDEKVGTIANASTTVTTTTIQETQTSSTIQTNKLLPLTEEEEDELNALVLEEQQEIDMEMIAEAVEEFDGDNDVSDKEDEEDGIDSDCSENAVEDDARADSCHSDDKSDHR
jgi:hypothetical protein